MKRSVLWISLGAGLALASGCAEEPEPPGPHSAAGAVERAAGAAGGANRPPRIERLRLEPSSPVPGERLRAAVTVRDPDGDRVTQGFRWEIEGRELAEGGSQLELRGVAKGDRVTVFVTASDGRAESDAAQASVEVANRRPVLENVALQPLGSVLPGQPAVATPVARDPDGDELSYRFRWTVDGEPVAGEEESQLPTEGLAPGQQIQVQAVAGDGEAESDAVWSGVLLVGNAAPEIVSQPKALGPGQAFLYAVEARDPEGDRNLRYSLRKGPDGMTINPVLGELRWQPRLEQAGVHPVEIAVEDSAGGRAVQSFELVVGSPAAVPASPSP